MTHHYFHTRDYKAVLLFSAVKVSIRSLVVFLKDHGESSNVADSLYRLELLETQIYEYEESIAEGVVKSESDYLAIQNQIKTILKEFRFYHQLKEVGCEDELSFSIVDEVFEEWLLRVSEETSVDFNESTLKSRGEFPTEFVELLRVCKDELEHRQAEWMVENCLEFS